MAPIAGANWGSVAVPRVGTEVLVDFIDGDIDRPVVIGSLYNGMGGTDAQNNQIAQGAGAATGNAPPWFPGEAGAHAHPAVLSGFKTQAMAASQSGTGAYSQLVFDDSPGQSRVALQRHAGQHKGTAELNMGHVRHQSDNQRLQPAGFGAELKTEHGVALRAAAGMLISADGRANASGAQLDSREAQSQIQTSLELQTTLATTAEKHNAVFKGQPEPEKLPALAQMAHSAEVSGATAKGKQAAAGAGGQGEVAAYSEPHLQLSSPKGIAATTPASAIVSARNTSSISAGQDINFASQGNSFHAAGGGIGLFTYGKADQPNKPNQETGIRLHAASGMVSMQSQSDKTRITAANKITVASVSKAVTVAAKEHVMLSAMGAFIKLDGRNIMLHGPGKIDFKASMKELTGPATNQLKLPLLPVADGEPGDQHFVLTSHSGAPVRNRRYRASTGNQVIEGFTDAAGKSKLLDGFIGQAIRFELIDERYNEHFILRDPLGVPLVNMPYKIRSSTGIEVTGVTDDSGYTDLFTSEEVEKIELLYFDQAFENDEGTD